MKKNGSRSEEGLEEDKIQSEIMEVGEKWPT